MSKVTTIIDIGSNSMRMVVLQKSSRFAFSLINETKSRVKISEGCYENNGNLQDIPMQRAFESLKSFLNISNALKSRKIMCVATSALRDAPNSKVFISKMFGALTSLVLAGLMLFTFYIDYAAIFREHRDLKGMISPQNVIASSISYYKKKAPRQNLPLIKYGEDTEGKKLIAKKMNIGLTTLYRKMKRFNIKTSTGETYL